MEKPMKTQFVNKFLAFTTKTSIAFVNHQAVLFVIGMTTPVWVNDQLENCSKDPQNLTATEQKISLMRMEDAYAKEKSASIIIGKRLETSMQLMLRYHSKLTSKS